ncbi:efflux RND transporter periplasmic adaptor subunit [Rehaibacterium terrae]|jgi:membrane fusion protein (multidrug efflux system)|uniref:Membrane fusion protein (Multidrug efflux system) n=1 Tax=Rehaibacterium terrae TaxID=1341696 RepID=A0A7W8DE24_9GAMM|nr:efflux RND transporter periplasmic adaptor subunit [Rehaibacterium terrae]MBB5015467.1 membrane fusion protein (multidrug efflux system) [Rehaibacterium terrae]
MRRLALLLSMLVPSPLVFAQGFPVAVETAQVAARSLDDTLTTVGTLRADESVVLRPEVAGRIEKIHFSDGDRVKAGALLFSLDAALLRAEVNEAAANLERSRRAYERARELVGRQLLSRADFDAAKAGFDVDRARLASARARLDKMTIRAPFDGVVGLRQVSPGDFVGVGQALVNLVRLDPMLVDFRLPEVHLGRIVAGQTVKLTVDAWPGREFAGTVSAVDPQIDIDGRSALVRARVGNQDGALRPGLFARVALVLARRAEALVVPEQAIWPVGDKRHVFRVEDGVAKLVEVRTGQRLPGLVEIVSGLSAGDVVVTAGQLKLRDGAQVVALPPPGAEAADGQAAGR